MLVLLQWVIKRTAVSRLQLPKIWEKKGIELRKLHFSEAELDVPAANKIYSIWTMRVERWSLQSQQEESKARGRVTYTAKKEGETISLGEQGGGVTPSAEQGDGVTSSTKQGGRVQK